MPPHSKDNVSFTCRLSIQIHEVSCVRGSLSSRQALIVHASALGQQQSTQALCGPLPLRYNQGLFFSQVFSNVPDAATLHLQLQGEHVQFELLQQQLPGQSSAAHAGTPLIGECRTTVGNLLTALQRPQRLVNGSLAVSTGLVELTSSVSMSRAQFLLRYSIDVSIMERPQCARPLIDLPSFSQVRGTTATPVAGTSTKHERPLNVFEGDDDQFYQGPSVSRDQQPGTVVPPGVASQVPAPATASAAPPSTGSSFVAPAAALAPNCHECVDRRTGAASIDPHTALSHGPHGQPPPRPKHSQDLGEGGGGGVPSLSPFAPKRTLVHCALPRSTTGLPLAKPLHSTCLSHYDTTTGVQHQRPFVVRHVSSDLLRRRPDPRPSSAGPTSRGCHSVEFVDHPSRPSRATRRHSSPPRTAASQDSIHERSPLKPSREAAQVSRTSIARQALNMGRPDGTTTEFAKFSVGSHAAQRTRQNESVAQYPAPPLSSATQSALKKTLPLSSRSHRDDPLRPGRVSFAAHDAGTDSNDSSASTLMAPILVTASPASSDTNASSSLPPSPPLSPSQFAPRQHESAPVPPAAGVPTSSAHDAAPLPNVDVAMRRMQRCGDEVKKLSTELQTRIDSLLADCCSLEQQSAANPNTTRCASSANHSSSHDLDELRSSLHSARQERLRQHQTPAVERPVRIADDCYWTQQMAKYAGQSHREVFDETLEKAYVDLYQRATKIT